MVIFITKKRNVGNLFCKFFYLINNHKHKSNKFNFKNSPLSEIFKNNILDITQFKKEIEIIKLFDLWICNKNTLDIYKTYLNHLIPKKHILDKINYFAENHFDDNTVSVHIRSWLSSSNSRSNNKKSKDRRINFDINTYIYHMKKFNNKKFFIAIDNFELKKKLLNIFGDKVIFYKRDKCLNAFINDYIELVLLSKNEYFISSYRSTFSQISFLYFKNIKELIYGDEYELNENRTNPKDLITY